MAQSQEQANIDTDKRKGQLRREATCQVKTFHAKELVAWNFSI